MNWRRRNTVLLCGVDVENICILQGLVPTVLTDFGTNHFLHSIVISWLCILKIKASDLLKSSNSLFDNYSFIS